MKHKNILILGISLFLILFLALLTNPTKADLEKHYASTIKKELNISNDGIMSWGSEKFAGGMRFFTTETNYKLFSLYRLDLPGEELDVTFLGLFGNFIPLKQSTS